MRIPSKSDPNPGSNEPVIPEDLSSEIRIWLDRGWKIIPSKRRGIVLSGEKHMRGLTKLLLILGILLLAAFFFHQPLIGAVGVLFVIGAVLDYRFNTKPETKFFPEPGEKVRAMER